jgi:uncharacterized protein YutD
VKEIIHEIKKGIGKIYFCHFGTSYFVFGNMKTKNKKLNGIVDAATYSILEKNSAVPVLLDAL